MQSLFPKISLCSYDILAIVICSIPAFYLLGTPAIYIWDEAVYANASFDMANGSSWLLPNEGIYNTKPPLVLWLQAISLMIFPWPEWAIRLPSALAVVGILVLLVIALRRWGYDQWTRILVMVAFVGHEGFIRQHISRTGDLDAVMTFFVTGYVLVVLDAIHFNRWTRKHLITFFLMVIAAFYAKSIGGWIMLGPLAIIWMLSPLRKVFLSGKFWIGAFISLACCLLYYLLRESKQPGYMELTWFSEYMRMFKNIMPWHEHPLNYYFKNFVILKTYTPWIFVLMIAIVYSLFFVKEKPVRDHLQQWIILALGYMLIISIPAVKLEWYDAPAYPFFSLIIGVTAGYITRNIPARWKYLWLIPILLILWRKINFITKDIHPRHPFEHEGSILRKASVSNNTKVYMPVETYEHRLQLDFYKKLVRKEQGLEIPVFDNVTQISPGDHIILRQDHLKQVTDVFTVDTMKVWNGLGYELVIEPKSK